MEYLRSCAGHSIRSEANWLPVPRLSHLWLGLPVFYLLCKGLIFPLPLLDFWWHLKMGEVIFSSASIPRVDIFSFTAAGRHFIVHNWLAEIIYYMTYRVGDFPLLICLNVGLLIASLLPVYLVCLKASNKQKIAVFAAMIIVISIPCNPRPQVFSFAMFALFLWIVLGYCRAWSDRIWLLPVLMLLWVNLHGAFVLGLVLVALILSGEAIQGFGFQGLSTPMPRRRLQKLALIFLLCCAATLINPAGPGVYSYIATVLGDPSSQRLVIEWQAPRIDTIQGLLQFYFPFLLSAAVLIGSRQRPSATDFLLFFGFAVLGLTAIRNAVWFSMVSGILIATYLPYFDYGIFARLKELAKALRINSTPQGAMQNSKRKDFGFLNLLIAASALLIIGILSPWVRTGLLHRSLLETTTPVGAMDYIEKNSLEGNIFHPQGYGDYLIWRLWPRQKSFFDGRVHLFGEDFVRQYQQIFRDSQWEKLLEPYNIQFLLLDKERNSREGGRKIIESARASGRWSLRYEDDLSVLFEKVANRNSE